LKNSNFQNILYWADLSIGMGGGSGNPEIFNHQFEKEKLQKREKKLKHKRREKGGREPRHSVQRHLA
jgi:hypothetical protein